MEHGGWGLLFEPIVLGLLLAPSLAGLFLSVAAMGAFLARHPFKLAVGDWRRGRRWFHTTLAVGFVVLYVCIAARLFRGIKDCGADFSITSLDRGADRLGSVILRLDWPQSDIDG